MPRSLLLFSVVARAAVAEQIHLSLGGDASSMLVNWASWEERDSGRVWYRQVSESSKWSFEEGSSRVWNYTLKSGGWITEDYKSPYLYSTLLRDLEPDSFYEYYIDDNATKKPRTFKTLKEKYPLTVAVVGDQGQTEFAKETAEKLLNLTESSSPVSERPAFTLFAGDLSYADGRGPRWDSFANLVEPLYSRLPMMTLPGNHEIEYEADTGRTFTSYRKRYGRDLVETPEILNTSSRGHKYHYDVFNYDFGSSYYSFKVGPAIFLMLNTYAPAENFSYQKTWLEREFYCLDRQKTPWVVVGMHAPWYSSSRKHRVEDEWATRQHKANLEKLFIKNKVPLVFAGHVHAYERSHPVCFQQISAAGPTYITVGDGGNHEGLYDKWSDSSWSAFKDGSSYGFGTVDFLNDTHARWRWLPNDDQQGNARDDVIVQNLVSLEKKDDDPCDLPLEEDFDFDCDATDILQDLRRKINGENKSSDRQEKTRPPGGSAILTIVLVALAAVSLALATAYSITRAQAITPKSLGWTEVDAGLDNDAAVAPHDDDNTVGVDNNNVEMV